MGKIEVAASTSLGRTAYGHDIRDTRTFNVNPELSKDNITLIDNLNGKTVEEYTNEMMQPIIDEYNIGKKKSRQISTDYVTWHRNNKNLQNTALSYEFVMQYGEHETLGKKYYESKGEEHERLKKEFEETYKKWIAEFQEKFPHLKVLYAVIHFDEDGRMDLPENERKGLIGGTPHLHICIQPVGEYDKKGLQQQISISKALANDGIERVQTRAEAQQEGGFQLKRLFNTIKHEIQEPSLEEMGYAIKQEQHGREHIDSQLFQQEKKIIDQEIEQIKAQQQDEINKQQAEFEEIQRQNQTTLDAQTRQVNAAKQQLQTLQDKKEEVKDEISQLGENIQTLSDQKSELEKATKTAQQEKDTIEKQKEQAQKELAQTQEELETDKKTIKKILGKIPKLTRVKVSGMFIENYRYEGKKEEMETIAKALGVLETLDEQKDKIRAEQARINAEKTAIRGRLDQAKAYEQSAYEHDVRNREAFERAVNERAKEMIRPLNQQINELTETVEGYNSQYQDICFFVQQQFGLSTEEFEHQIEGIRIAQDLIDRGLHAEAKYEDIIDYLEYKECPELAFNMVKAQKNAINNAVQKALSTGTFEERTAHSKDITKFHNELLALKKGKEYFANKGTKAFGRVDWKMQNMLDDLARNNPYDGHDER